MPPPRRLRLLVTVTLNANQLRGYMLPILALPEVESVTLVADAPAPELPKLRTVVPPRLLTRALGRAGAKLVVCLGLALRDRPDWVLGYNLTPHGINATIAGRASRSEVLYVMMGGTREWEGGGWKSDNRLLGRLREPSQALEALFFWFVQQCTVVVTMGNGARRALLERGLEPSRVVALPASVEEERFRPRSVDKDYALVTAGALIPIKRTHDLIEAVARLRVERPWVRAAILGQGPLAEELQARARELGVEDAVDFLGFRQDVESFYARSLVFVLPSQFEGLSLAMVDALASGLPVVVSDVGEARDVVVEGRNGYLYPAGDVDALVDRLATLLDDRELRERLGRAGTEDARRVAGVERLSEEYRSILRQRGDGVRGVRVLATVTFNPNQLQAHLRPILELPEVEEVVLVADAAGPPMPKLRTVVPNRHLARLLGRAGAKLAVCVALAHRRRPDWIVGYSLVPHGINACLTRILMGGRVAYVMIGSTKEWTGGGWDSDNRILGRLSRPVPALEALFFRFVRGFDAVVTMGTDGRRELIERGIAPGRVVPIPASPDERRFHPRPGHPKEYDLLTVGSLIERKQTRDFVEAVARLRSHRPALRAAILGTGPLDQELRAQARRLGIDDAVDFLGFRRDVEEVYARSRVFVLTSRFEGLSVALIDAMASGLPAVVSDVGEARDLVREGRNGYLFEAGDVDALVRRLEPLLDEPALRERLGRAAAEDAAALAGVRQTRDLYRLLLTGAPPGQNGGSQARRGEQVFDSET